MSKAIFRYRLEITDEPNVMMPVGADVLSVGPPRDGGSRLDLWARVDMLLDGSPIPDEYREFRIVGTGHPMPNDCGRFIGTVPTHGGVFIWHIFEKGTE